MNDCNCGDARCQICGQKIRDLFESKRQPVPSELPEEVTVHTNLYLTGTVKVNFKTREMTFIGEPKFSESCFVLVFDNPNAPTGADKLAIQHLISSYLASVATPNMPTNTTVQ